MYELGIFFGVLALLMRPHEPVIATMLLVTSGAILVSCIANSNKTKDDPANGVLLDPRDLPVLYRTPVWL